MLRTSVAQMQNLMRVFHVILLMMFATTSIVSAAPSSTFYENSGGSWHKELVSQTRFPLAACLDGSPPGFHILQPDTPSTVWVIHMPGGGWCDTVSSCIKRSSTLLGSSSLLPPTPTKMVNKALMQSEESLNPEFYAANKVSLSYCDGSSYVGGLRDKPRKYSRGRKKLYLGRGAANFEAMVRTIIEDFRMSSASRVLIKGCSAGGLAAILHVDHLSSWLPNSSVVAAPEGGIFLDHPSYNRKNIPGSSLFRRVAKLHGVYSNLQPECLSSFAKRDHWRCFMGQEAFRFVKAPLFIFNSIFDTWQLLNILGLSRKCRSADHGEVKKLCSRAEREAMVSFDTTFRAVLRTDANAFARTSFFVDACHSATHCSQGYDKIVSPEQRERGGLLGITAHEALTFWWRALDPQFSREEVLPIHLIDESNGPYFSSCPDIELVGLTVIPSSVDEPVAITAPTSAEQKTCKPPDSTRCKILNSPTSVPLTLLPTSVPTESPSTWPSKAPVAAENTLCGGLSANRCKRMKGCSWVSSKRKCEWIHPCNNRRSYSRCKRNKACSWVGPKRGGNCELSTLSPTGVPSKAPIVRTSTPSSTPTQTPSSKPSSTPTQAPSLTPSLSPTAKPTWSPSRKPTAAPTSRPSFTPTKTPTMAPTLSPTSAPTTTSPTAPPTFSDGRTLEEQIIFCLAAGRRKGGLNCKKHRRWRGKCSWDKETTTCRPRME